MQEDDYPVDRVIWASDHPELHLRKKVPVTILGATGLIGQKLVLLLHKHPWMYIEALVGSDRSVGKKYKDAVEWQSKEPLPTAIEEMELVSIDTPLSSNLVFSALPEDKAKEYEVKMANNGAIVIGCSAAHRDDPDVPLIVPEVNMMDLALLDKQIFENNGKIIAKPNCIAGPLSIVLKPLISEFGVQNVTLVTMQAISGAGFPGVSGIAIMDNIIPYIAGEEEKIEKEPKKILGWQGSITATALRVPVTEGHLACVEVTLEEKTSIEQFIRALEEFESKIAGLALPSMAQKVIHYRKEKDFPQPKLHIMLDHGMAVSIGHVKEIQEKRYSFLFLAHNTIRGGAGQVILTAELLIKQGRVFW